MIPEKQSTDQLEIKIHKRLIFGENGISAA